jgi:hypothetical protein
MKANQLLNEVVKTQPRSQWAQGVKLYAIELLQDVHPETDLTSSNLDKHILNGARDVKQYSEGGEALVWNYDIAERLCTPSEFERKDYGRRNPNKQETWIDCQTRALYQARVQLLALISQDK